MDLILNIIAFTILVIAVFFASKKIINRLKPKEKINCESGCSGCKSSCGVKNN